MPRLSVVFIRSALAYLGAGFSIGALLLANKGLPFNADMWNWLPVHMEFLLVGWMAELALGMAFWILPRFGVGAPRGDEKLIWLAFILINAGIWLVALGALFSAAWLPVIGRIAETGAILAFASGSWRRIRPFAT